MKTKYFFMGFLCGAAALALFAVIAACASLNAGDVVRGVIGIASGGGNGGGDSDRQAAAGGCSGGNALSAADGCSGGNALGGSSGDSVGSGGGQVTVYWPSPEEWDGYGLRNLRQPGGSSVTNVAILQGTYIVTLGNAGTDAYNDVVSQIRQLLGVSQPYSQIRNGNGEMIEFRGASHWVQLAADFGSNELMIRCLQ
jgi:hypothetical protein